MTFLLSLLQANKTLPQDRNLTSIISHIIPLGAICDYVISDAMLYVSIRQNIVLCISVI